MLVMNDLLNIYTIINPATVATLIDIESHKYLVLYDNGPIITKASMVLLLYATLAKLA